ncbi:YggT family protein [Spiractinospora alimapuensis]|uniref:YggT family protein n=1 Tax=Spiractinospora alimapuensis TaxID=2820884 RepID=UPI001F3B78D5|nr:YggT family protein [Spiractinospora alimapuensis]QVQ53127.1 YggT family protein [Spiractinospora alimapuensis]
MNIVLSVIQVILYLFMMVLIARLILEWVRNFARSWSPTGLVLVLAEIVYTITDPPLSFLRRFIPVVRLGSLALDLSFLALFLIVVILLQVVTTFQVI